MAESKKTFMEDVDMEMTTAEARKYFERGFKVLAEFAEDSKLSTADRFKATIGLQAYYLTIAAPEFIDTQTNKQGNQLDKIRKMRDKKSWEDESESE